MIKALFFDIDGTLADCATHRPSERTFQMLLALHERGIKLFVATGRHTSVPDQGFILDAFPSVFDGFISMNGQLNYLADKTVTARRMLPPGAVKSVLECAKRNTIPFTVAEETRIYTLCLRDDIKKIQDILGLPYPATGLLPADLNGIYMISLFTSSAPQLLDQLPGCEVLRWMDGIADIVPDGCGKHIGVDAMLSYFGIDRSESMAFGDEINDISMLRHAGIGVAMGNAREEVKHAADYITLPDVQDGVLAALQHFGVLPQ